MKAKKYWVLVVVTICCVTVFVCVGNANSEKQKIRKYSTTVSKKRDSLVGLEDIKVLVELLNPAAKKYGLTRQALQTDTELQLRQNGIGVLSLFEDSPRPGNARLYVNICIAISKEMGVAAVNISVELHQTVLLKRDPTKAFHGVTTWEEGSVVLPTLNNLKNIRGDVKDHVEEFINDYLAANPKERTPKNKDN